MEILAGGSGAAGNASVVITESDVATLSLADSDDPTTAELAAAEAARVLENRKAAAAASVVAAQTKVDRQKEHLDGAEDALAQALAEQSVVEGEAI